MVRSGRRNNNTRKNAVSNVRIVDQYSGTDGARVDRILSFLQNSHSQIRVLCSDNFTQTTAASAFGGVVTGANIRATDDFLSFSAQFETFRVLAIRFDVYDIAPATNVTNYWSTFHDVTTGVYAPFPIASILDAPDSQVIPPGSGKSTFTWFAHGSQENDFESTTNSGIQDFGGLRFSVGGGTSGVAKYQIVMKAIVDFRGRT